MIEWCQPEVWLAIFPTSSFCTKPVITCTCITQTETSIMKATLNNKCSVPYLLSNMDTSYDDIDIGFYNGAILYK